MLNFQHFFLFFGSVIFLYLLIHIDFCSLVPLLIFSLFLFHLFSVKFNFVGLWLWIGFVWEIQFHIQESEFFLTHFVDFLPDDVASVIFSDTINSVISIYFLLVFITGELLLFTATLFDFFLTRILGFLRDFDTDSASFVHLDDTNGGLEILDHRH